MKQRILIVGAGFAGMWNVPSAVRQFGRQGRDDVEVAMLASQPGLRVHPRFYEPGVQRMAAPLDELFAAVDARFVRGSAQYIDVVGKRVEYHDTEGTPAQLDCSRLVLAAGSGVWRPASVVGIDAAFDVGQLKDALRLEAHPHALRDLSDSPARNAVVATDGGFTGIGTVTEIPACLWAILDEKTVLRVIVIDRGTAIDASIGADLSGLIAEVSAELDMEWYLGRSVTAMNAEGVTLDDGQRIKTKTVIWTVDARTNTLTGQTPGERDTQSHLRVDHNLEVLGLDGVYATGDVTHAATDDLGNHALMTCQRAVALGRSADNNMAADLLGVEPIPYSQVKYVTCPDLGSWGAVFTGDWGHRVWFAREEGKKIRTEINGAWIYPPTADCTVALAAADPLIPVVT